MEMTSLLLRGNTHSWSVMKTQSEVLTVELHFVKSIGRAKFRSRSHDAVIHVYDDVGNLLETHAHKGEKSNYDVRRSPSPTIFFTSEACQ